MKNELLTNDIKVPVVLVEKFDKLGISNDEASSLMSSFGLPLVEAGPLLDSCKDICVTDELDLVTMKLARETRLKLSKIRCSVENTRKDLKSEFLRKGDAIQAVANYIKEAIEPAEKYLELQEKFADIKKAERDAKIKSERIEKLMQYTDNISMYNIDGLEDDTFEFLLTKVKKEYDDKISAEKDETERLEKEEAERKAEQERIVAENARLRKEAEEKEVALAIERKKEAGKQAKIDADNQRKFDEANAAIVAEREKRETIEAEQRKKDEFIAREKADKEAAEAKSIADAKKAEMDALLSPDKDKLISFSAALEKIRKEKLPAVKTKQAQDVVNIIDEMLIKMQNIIMSKAKEL
jgi:hypothetical protein